MCTPASARRILVASLVGTAVEFYDFYVYATAASLVFGPLFFPSDSASTQLLGSFGSLGVAFVARPIGSVLFGHFGDRVGRKSTLVASLLVMGLSTVAIAFLPTYADAGWWAPFLLCLLRFGQGIGLGGEWGGAALLAVENAPPGSRGRWGMVPQLGAPIGFLAANGMFLALGGVLTPEQFAAWGWRLPFLGSLLLVGVGLWVRLKLTETPAFAAVLAAGPPPAVPLAEAVRDHGGKLIAGGMATVACYATFYIATTFTLAHGTTALGFARGALLELQLGAVLFMAAAVLVSGWLTDRIGARAVLTIGCAGTIGAGFLIAPLLGSGSPPAAFGFMAATLVCMGLLYGPLGAWLPGLFPARVRYTSASIALNAGGIVGGAVTPFAAVALAKIGGLAPVGLYLSATGVLSLLGLLALRPRRGAAA